MIASAAYWIGSAADEIVAVPPALTGSISVVVVHEDRSGENVQRGVGVSYIHAGKYKAEGNPDCPLTAEARGGIQQTIDNYYGEFMSVVAKARRTTAAAVRAGYNEGRA